MISELQDLLSMPNDHDVRHDVVERLLRVQRNPGSNDNSFQELIVNGFRRIDNPTPDIDWCVQLVRLATEADDEFVRHRAVYWELDTLPFQAPDLIDPTIAELRKRLIEGDTRVSILAARALWAFGVRWPDAASDLRFLLDKVGLNTTDRSCVLNLAGTVGAFEKSELHEMIDDLLAGEPDFSRILGTLISVHGEERHWWFLERSFLNANSMAFDRVDRQSTLHDLLGSMLEFGRRWPNLQAVIEGYFLDLVENDASIVIFGWEHLLYRFYDAPKAVPAIIRSAIMRFGEDKNIFPSVSVVKSLNRPAHLQAILDMRQELWTLAENYLKQSIVASSGNVGIFQTIETLRKEGALVVATILGLPQLPDWEVEALSVERTPFLIKRLAEDCMFWGNSSFLGTLPDLKLEGKANPIYLIDEFSGFLEPGAAFDILLKADGRFGMEDVLKNYADALGYLAASERTCSRLTACITNDNEPLWRRRACVYAIGQAMAIVPDIEVDWNVVSDVILDSSYPGWCSDALAVTVASHHVSRFQIIIENLGAERLESTRFCLACILAGVRTKEVLARLEDFRNPDSVPVTSDFTLGYAALCISHLYQKRIFSGDDLLEFCRGGLRHDIGGVFGAIDFLREQSVTDFLEEKTKDQNNSWRSDPSFWHLLAKLAPERLTGKRLLAHVTSCSRNALRSYLDTIARLSDYPRNEIFTLLVDLSLERDRPIAWHAARIATRLAPETLTERIEILMGKGDAGIRSAYEHYMWSSEWDLAKAHALAAKSRMTSLEEYVDQLDEVRQQIGWADAYLNKVITSESLLTDWLYVQALLDLPSEDVLATLQNYEDNREWSPTKGRQWYLRKFLAENIEKKLKKNREELWRNSRLPGEEAFPQW